MTAEYFDEWFAAVARSQGRHELFERHLGTPPEVDPSNLLPIEGLQAVADALAVTDEGEIADLACGRGGPGMWVARATGARLIGVDFSAEAIRQASERRMLFGLAERATFAVGTLSATGLSAGAVDGVMCIDAFQFASDGQAAAEEFRRILRPGGRVALTTWEPIDHSDERVSERLRRVDLAAVLAAAGFRDVSISQRDDWRQKEHALWLEAAELDPAGDPALESAVEEANRVLPTWDLLRRVFATAVAP